MTSAALPLRSAAWRRVLSRNGWVLGVWLLLGALLVWYSTLIPVFGQFQVVSISKNSLPLVYLAIGQGIIVIAGGIDLSLGALLLLSNAFAARFMDDQPLGIVLLIALAVITGIGALNALTGYVISISGVPDIVVTLATSYIWSGFALWVLPSPGGGTAPQFRWLFTGSESGIGGSYIMPVLMMAIPSIAVFILSRRSRLGLSIYAIGSDSVAARLAGLDVRRAKIAAYAIGGAMAALAGLATVALTGTGDPRFSIGANATLNSVAAIVLGGIPLTGGAGSVLGVVAAGVILIMLNPILSAMGINPNNAQIIQGVLIAGVMMIGGLVVLLRERAS
jgi:ribose transport system permease protein